MSYYYWFFNLAFASGSANYLLCTSTCTDPNCWEVWSDKWALPVKDNIEIHVSSFVFVFMDWQVCLYIFLKLRCSFVASDFVTLLSLFQFCSPFYALPSCLPCKDVETVQNNILLHLIWNLNLTVTILYLKLPSSTVTATALDAVISYTLDDGI